MWCPRRRCKSRARAKRRMKRIEGAAAGAGSSLPSRAVGALTSWTWFELRGDVLRATLRRFHWLRRVGRCGRAGGARDTEAGWGSESWAWVVAQCFVGVYHGPSPALGGFPSSTGEAKAWAVACGAGVPNEKSRRAGRRLFSVFGLPQGVGVQVRVVPAMRASGYSTLKLPSWLTRNAPPSKALWALL